MISGADTPARIDQAQERKTKMSQDKATYEGMFLLDAGNPDFQAASEPVRTILDRNEATALAIKPWDERRLAYEIKGRRRGLYVLSYFQAEPGRISEIERDCQLDERILRVMLLRRDGLTEELIETDTPATASARRLVEQAEQADKKDQPAADQGKKDQPAADDDDIDDDDIDDDDIDDDDIDDDDIDDDDIDDDDIDDDDIDDDDIKVAADTDAADANDATSDAATDDGDGKEGDDDNLHLPGHP